MYSFRIKWSKNTLQCVVEVKNTLQCVDEVKNTLQCVGEVDNDVGVNSLAAWWSGPLELPVGKRVKRSTIKDFNFE